LPNNTRMEKIPSALEGIRVLELGQYIIAPEGASLLGDLGAEVIKIENITGESMRALVVNYGVDMRIPEGKLAMFERFNRNKKSLAIDLKSDMGKRILYQLAGKSDVFMTNLRQEAIKRLKADYDTLAQHNPRLVYVSASGYGTKGPEAGVGAHDLTALAKCGLMMQSGEEGMPPVLPTQGMCDQIAAVGASYAALVGLMARDRRGMGQHIQLSHLGTMMGIQSDCIWLWGVGKKYGRQTRAHTPNPLYNFYRCKDDRWIAIAALQEKHWPRVCKALKLTGLENDPRFKSSEQRTGLGRSNLLSILEEVFATEICEVWLKNLQEEDVPVSRVNGIEDLLSDSQVNENNYLPKYEHPILGLVGVPGIGMNIDYSETPAKLETWAPEVGQHTEEIIHEILGYSWDDIADLKDSGVI
jgi:CoA:oxalate CoA-transferase